MLTDPAPSLERAEEGGGVVPANVPLYPHLQRRRRSRGEVEHNLLVVLGLSLPMQDGHKESNAGGSGESSGGEGTPDFPTHCPREHQRRAKPSRPPDSAGSSGYGASYLFLQSSALLRIDYPALLQSSALASSESAARATVSSRSPQRHFLSSETRLLSF